PVARECAARTGAPPDAGAHRCPRSSCAAVCACAPARPDELRIRSAPPTFARQLRPVISPSLLTCLSDLAADLLSLVAHALALVGVGTAQAADVRRDLADLLLVDPRDRELRRRLDRERDALGRLDHHGMAVAQRELE